MFISSNGVRVAGSYRQYRIESKQIRDMEKKSVYRRYRDFEWLYQILTLKYPTCIISPIPPKNVMMSYWTPDESE